VCLCVCMNVCVTQKQNGDIYGEDLGCVCVFMCVCMNVYVTQKQNGDKYGEDLRYVCVYVYECMCNIYVCWGSGMCVCMDVCVYDLYT
jgi:hypothetical protein